MKHKGYDECSEYEYHDIINYKHCCTCEHFYDNEKAQRFECLREPKPRCKKCIYELQCSKDKDNDRNCPDYKRDAPDGGYYG